MAWLSLTSTSGDTVYVSAQHVQLVTPYTVQLRLGEGPVIGSLLTCSEGAAVAVIEPVAVVMQRLDPPPSNS
jgi:hypothetical protein